MFNSRTKTDLIIEVWEKLDCESVGSREIEAIMTAVEGEFGSAAVDSPMVIARLLADEGAELRHSEILELYVKRAEDRPYAAAFRDIVKLDDFDSAAATIRRLENLRKVYLAETDAQGLRLVRDTALNAKRELTALADRPREAGKLAATFIYVQRRRHGPVPHWCDRLVCRVLSIAESEGPRSARNSRIRSVRIDE